MIQQTVYVVTEEEPDTSTEFPYIVIGTYATRALAEAEVMRQRKKRGLVSDLKYEDADISWNIEATTVEGSAGETDQGIIARALCLRIAEHLDGKEWGADDPEIIADMLHAAGYVIRDPDDMPHDPGYHDTVEEAYECTACHPPEPTAEEQARQTWEQVQRAYAYVREAQRLLKANGARQAWGKVKRILKSVQGAERHAYGKYTLVRK